MYQNTALLVPLLVSLAITALVAYSSYSEMKRFVFLYEISGTTLKAYIAIERVVLFISGSTIVFLLAQHEVILPHHKIVVFAPECMLLGICAGLCIAFEISSTGAQDSRNRRKRYMQPDDYERFGKWAAANRTIAISALCCLGFAYFGIVVTLFG
jgi:hypothetical protein